MVADIKPTLTLFAPATHHAPATEHEKLREWIKNGQCPNCGLRTHKLNCITKAKTALAHDDVFRGRCLKCKPLLWAGNLLVQYGNCDRYEGEWKAVNGTGREPTGMHKWRKVRGRVQGGSRPVNRTGRDRST